MTCPITHPSDQDVLALVNLQNSADLTKDDVNIEVPSVVNDGERNTKLLVTAQPDGRYGSFVEIMYDRLELLGMFHGAEEVEIIVGGEPDFQDIVCGLNTTYGTTFDSAEFTGTPVVDDVMTLTAKPESHGYIGSIKVRLIHERIHLQDRLMTVDLNGFIYPNANTPSPNNIIFTRNPTVNGQQRYFADNGDLKVAINVIGPGGLVQPSLINGDPQGYRVTTGNPIGSGSYRHPQVSMLFKASDARTFLQLMQEYDFEMVLGSTNGTFTMKPVAFGTNQVRWEGEGVNAATDHTFANAPNNESYMTFDFGRDYAGTTTPNGKLKTLGMRAGGGGASEGVLGIITVSLRAQRLNTPRPWKQIVVNATVSR